MTIVPPAVLAKGRDGAQEAGGRRQIALELDGLARGPRENREPIHNSEALGRAPSSEYLSELVPSGATPQQVAAAADGHKT